MNPLPSTLYRIDIMPQADNALDDFLVRYSRDGGANFVNCADYDTVQIVSTSLASFTKITCYITTDGAAAANPYVYFTSTDGTARHSTLTPSRDANSNTTPNVQVGRRVNSSTNDIVHIRQGVKAPQLPATMMHCSGGMYYDTTLGNFSATKPTAGVPVVLALTISSQSAQNTLTPFCTARVSVQ